MKAMNPYAKLYPRKQVEIEVSNIENKVHPFAIAHNLPHFVFKWWFARRIRE